MSTASPLIHPSSPQPLIQDLTFNPDLLLNYRTSPPLPMPPNYLRNADGDVGRVNDENYSLQDGNVNGNGNNFGGDEGLFYNSNNPNNVNGNDVNSNNAHPNPYGVGPGNVDQNGYIDGFFNNNAYGGSNDQQSYNDFNQNQSMLLQQQLHQHQLQQQHHHFAHPDQQQTQQIQRQRQQAHMDAQMQQHMQQQQPGQMQPIPALPSRKATLPRAAQLPLKLAASAIETSTPPPPHQPRSLPKGISLSKSSKKKPYHAQFSFRGKMIYVGLYPTIPLALSALNAKRELLNINPSLVNVTSKKVRSLPKGVYYDKASKLNPYHAQFRYNGKVVHVGTFFTAEGARLATDKKRRSLGLVLYPIVNLGVHVPPGQVGISPHSGSGGGHLTSAGGSGNCGGRGMGVIDEGDNNDDDFEGPVTRNVSEDSSANGLFSNSLNFSGGSSRSNSVSSNSSESNSNETFSSKNGQQAQQYDNSMMNSQDGGTFGDCRRNGKHTREDADIMLLLKDAKRRGGWG